MKKSIQFSFFSIFFADLRTVVLSSRISQFWRHQKKSPRWYLATIEAIHQLLVELHTNAYGVSKDYENYDAESRIVDCKESTSGDDLNKPYNGEYDNLLYFFKYMYQKIHKIYDHEKLHAYRRPLYNWVCFTLLLQYVYKTENQRVISRDELACINLPTRVLRIRGIKVFFLTPTAFRLLSLTRSYLGLY